METTSFSTRAAPAAEAAPTTGAAAIAPAVAVPPPAPAAAAAVAVELIHEATARPTAPPTAATPTTLATVATIIVAVVDPAPRIRGDSVALAVRECVVEGTERVVEEDIADDGDGPVVDAECVAVGLADVAVCDSDASGDGECDNDDA